ncbi:conserved Plasmodium membrane protein, unknown function [Plasmodium gallinaceum]|uniref:Uncharacterized protein n=1 Tax=Plasmodium gallinaceum TaxID=5849 RepID=A0A1J1H0N8_PLAGA|nr:conserved Plasmodium membrane protein, unknown function [Plasmodium gallinaceum]CRG98013.1 conserved Plasmodium membrane protein, unknown function [Plasmodium gallinaceum]
MEKNEDSIKGKMLLNFKQINWQRINFILLVFLLGIKTFFCILLYIYNHILLFFVFFISTVVSFYALLVNSFKALILYIVVLLLILTYFCLSFYNVINVVYISNVFKETLFSNVLYSICPFLIIECLAALIYISLKKKKKSYIEKKLKELKIIVDGEKEEKKDDILSMQIDLEKNELNTCNNNYKYYLTHYKNKKYICIEKKIDPSDDENDFILDLEKSDRKINKETEKEKHKKKSHIKKDSTCEISEDLSFMHYGIKKYEKKNKHNNLKEKSNRKERKRKDFNKNITNDTIQNEKSNYEQIENVDDENKNIKNEEVKNESDNCIENEQEKKVTHISEIYVISVNKESKNMTNNSVNLEENQCDNVIKKNTSNNRNYLTVRNYEKNTRDDFNFFINENTIDVIDDTIEMNDTKNIGTESLKQKADILANSEEENCIIEDFIGKSGEELKKEDKLEINYISDKYNKQSLEIETEVEIKKKESLIEKNKEEIITDKKEKSENTVSDNEGKEKDNNSNICLLDNNGLILNEEKKNDKQNLLELTNSIVKEEMQVKSSLLNEDKIEEEECFESEINKQNDTKIIKIDEEFKTNFTNILSEENKENVKFSNKMKDIKEKSTLKKNEESINNDNKEYQENIRMNIITEKVKNIENNSDNNLNKNKVEEKLESHNNIINDEVSFNIENNSEGKILYNNNINYEMKECNKLKNMKISLSHKNSYDNHKILDSLKERNYFENERHSIISCNKKEKEEENENENMKYSEVIEKNKDTQTKEESEGDRCFENYPNVNFVNITNVKNNNKINDEYENKGNNVKNEMVENKKNSKNDSYNILVNEEKVNSCEEEEIQKTSDINDQHSWRRINKKDIEKLKESVNADNIEDIQIDYFYKKNKKGADADYSSLSINSSNLSIFLKTQKDENEDTKEKKGEILSKKICNKKEINNFKINSLDNICSNNNDQQNNIPDNLGKEEFIEDLVDDVMNKKSKESTQEILSDQSKFYINNPNYTYKSSKNYKGNESNEKFVYHLDNNSNAFYSCVNSSGNDDYINYEDVIKNNSKITDTFLYNRRYNECNQNNEMNPNSVDSLNNNIYDLKKNVNDFNAINDCSSILNSSSIIVKDSSVMNESNTTNYLNVINDSNNNNNSFINNGNDKKNYYELNSNSVFQKRIFFENLNREKSSNSVQRNVEYNIQKDDLKKDDSNINETANSDSSLNIYRKKNYVSERKKKNQYYSSKDENDMIYHIEKFAKLKKTKNIDDNYHVKNDKKKNKLKENGIGIEKNDEAILSNELLTRNIYNINGIEKDKKVEVANDFENKRKMTQHFVIYDQSDISSSRKTGENIKSNDVFDFDKKNDFEIINFSKIKLNNCNFGSNFKMKTDIENNSKKSILTNKEIINSNFNTDINNSFLYVDNNVNSVINQIKNDHPLNKNFLEEKNDLDILINDNKSSLMKKKKFTELKKKNKLTNKVFNEINFNEIKNYNDIDSYNQLNDTTINGLNESMFNKNLNLISTSSSNEFQYNEKKGFPNSHDFVKLNNEEFYINSKEQVTNTEEINSIHSYEGCKEENYVNKNNVKTKIFGKDEIEENKTCLDEKDNNETKKNNIKEKNKLNIKMKKEKEKSEDTKTAEKEKEEIYKITNEEDEEKNYKIEKEDNEEKVKDGKVDVIKKEQNEIEKKGECIERIGGEDEITEEKKKNEIEIEVENEEKIKDGGDDIIEKEEKNEIEITAKNEEKIKDEKNEIIEKEKNYEIEEEDSEETVKGGKVDVIEKEQNEIEKEKECKEKIKDEDKMIEKVEKNEIDKEEEYKEKIKDEDKMIEKVEKNEIDKEEEYKEKVKDENKVNEKEENNEIEIMEENKENFKDGKNDINEKEKSEIEEEEEEKKEKIKGMKNKITEKEEKNEIEITEENREKDKISKEENEQLKNDEIERINNFNNVTQKNTEEMEKSKEVQVDKMEIQENKEMHKIKEEIQENKEIKEKKEKVQEKENVKTNNGKKEIEREINDINKEDIQINIDGISKNENNIEAKIDETSSKFYLKIVDNRNDCEKEEVNSINEVTEKISSTEHIYKNNYIKSNYQDCDQSNTSIYCTQIDNSFEDNNKKKKNENLNSDTNKDINKNIYDKTYSNTINSDAHSNNISMICENNVNDHLIKNGEVKDNVIRIDKKEKCEFSTYLDNSTIDNLNETKENSLSACNKKYSENVIIKTESLENTNLKELDEHEGIINKNEENEICFLDEQINDENRLNENLSNNNENTKINVDKEQVIYKDNNEVNKNKDKKKHKRKRNKKNKER